MEEIILDDGAGDGYDVPDVPHVEIIFDALNDTLADVNGSEGLTQAQSYLSGVLNASGIANERVTGNEGFFSSIGTGAKSAFEYIKKMFKSLWEFFFKRDAPKLVEAAKKDLNESKETLDTLSTGGSSEAEADKVLSKQISALKALGHEPDVNKSALDQILKEADEAHKGSFADKKKAILMLSHEIPKLNKKAKKELSGKVDQLIAVLKSMKSTVEEADAGIAEASPLVKGLLTSMKAGNGNTPLLQQLEGIRDLSDVNKAKTVLGEMLKEIDSADNINKALKDHQSQIGASIKFIEGAIDSRKEAGKEDKGDLSKELASLRGLMVLVSKLSQLFKSMLSRMTSTQKSMTSIFGG